MRLPNAKSAFVDISKLADYCLNPDHEEGKHKARVFRRALNITRDQAAWLRQQLLDAAATQPAEMIAETEFDELFMLDFRLSTQHGSAIIRSGWMVRIGEDFPRLTTWFVKADPR